MNKLKLLQIKKSFGEVNVLNNISLSVKTGEFVSILGPSGCGKSTLFNIISGLALPDEGNIYLDDNKINGKAGKISFMHQKDLLLPWKTVLDNVCIPLYLNKIPKKKAHLQALKYFKTFGLEEFENVYPQQLSGGMRQRAALLRTYLFKNDIILLDEPFGALDAITRSEMQHWLKNIISEIKPTVLLVTHDIEEAILLSDRVIVLSSRPASIKCNLKIDFNMDNVDDISLNPKFLEYKKELRSKL